MIKIILSKRSLSGLSWFEYAILLGWFEYAIAKRCFLDARMAFVSSLF
ncbi:hypothetical protein [Brunnivagina elsteri]|nr:hypothetical protein [Calothrix elsteri]